MEQVRNQMSKTDTGEIASQILHCRGWDELGWVRWGLGGSGGGGGSGRVYARVRACVCVVGGG